MSFTQFVLQRVLGACSTWDANNIESSKPWSSQLWTQFQQLWTEAWKSFSGLKTENFFRLLFAIAEIAFITAMIMAYLISNPQFNIWNISYITSQYGIRSLEHQAISARYLCALHPYWNCLELWKEAVALIRGKLKVQ